MNRPMNRPVIDLSDLGVRYFEAIIDTLLDGGAVTPDEALFVGIHVDLLRTNPAEPWMVELAVTTVIDWVAVGEWLVAL